jgi:hypothetical protein
MLDPHHKYEGWNKTDKWSQSEGWEWNNVQFYKPSVNWTSNEN